MSAQDYYSKDSEDLLLWDIRICVFRLGAICCYEIVCPVRPRLMRLTMVSAAEMLVASEFPTDGKRWAVPSLGLSLTLLCVITSTIT